MGRNCFNNTMKSFDINRIKLMLGNTPKHSEEWAVLRAFMYCTLQITTPNKKQYLHVKMPKPLALEDLKLSPKEGKFFTKQQRNDSGFRP
jgi:hypothetical protein